MIQLTIESYGEQIVNRTLTRFEGEFENPRHTLEAIGMMLREAVEKQFDTEGRHASGGWPALAQSTKERKAQLGLDPHILRATDRLRQALIRKFDPEHVEHVAGDSLTFGATVPYGVYHQSSQPRKRLPYRPPVALSQEDKRSIVKTVQRQMIESARA